MEVIENEINTEEVFSFVNNIVHKTLKKTNHNRSAIRSKKLAQNFVESFLMNEETRYYDIFYDKDVIVNVNGKMKCDVVIKKDGTIKTIIMFRFPIWSLKKNDRNYDKFMKGEAIELETSPELNSNAKVFFINFYPNLENIEIKKQLPSEHFKKCSNIEVFYDVNEEYHKLQDEYKRGIFLNEKNNVISDFNIYNGSFSDINKSIYN